MFRKIGGVCRAYPYLLLLLYPVFHVCFFFLLDYIPLEHHFIECPLDTVIPFCEWFVLPYCIWFFYLFGGMVFFVFLPRKDFLRMSLFTMAGLAVCLLICLVYPTAIAFRPTSFARDNLLIRLTKLIYAADNPWNIFPSMHCYGAIGMTVAICKSKRLNRRRVIPVCSVVLCVLICLSTVFIKQHSVLDVAAAIALAIVMYPLAYCVQWRFLNGNDFAVFIRQKLRRFPETESDASVSPLLHEPTSAVPGGSDGREQMRHTRSR